MPCSTWNPAVSIGRAHGSVAGIPDSHHGSLDMPPPTAWGASVRNVPATALHDAHPHDRRSVATTQPSPNAPCCRIRRSHHRLHAAEIGNPPSPTNSVVSEHGEGPPRDLWPREGELWVRTAQATSIHGISDHAHDALAAHKRAGTR